jgi:transposase-like protein
MMAERGVTVSYESVREWCLKFGGTYTKRIRAGRGRLGDRWHLDEVFLRINGKLHYLWRAVDQDGEVLDILVQSRRHKQAAKKFFRKLLKVFSTFHGPSSPTNSAVTRQRSRLPSNIVSRKDSTTGRRILTSLPANANAAWAGSNQPDRRRDSSRPTG